MSSAAVAQPEPKARIRSDLKGEDVTTFRLGGKISQLFEPRTVDEACELFQSLQSQQPRFLGAGSNLLIPDEGLVVPVLRLGSEFSKFIFLRDGESVTVHTLESFRERDSGEPSSRLLAFGAVPLMSLSRRVSQHGLSGLEFAAGIPASIGGALRMNAGAHGSSIGECVESIFAVNQAGKCIRFDRESLSFAYRHISLPEKHWIVAGVFRFEKKSVEEVAQRRSSCLAYRKATQPLHLPSAGSVFRNPSADVAAAQILDRLGFKGMKLGETGYSDMHANWIVKLGDQGRARDVRALISLAREKVSATMNVQLECEVVVW